MSKFVTRVVETLRVDRESEAQKVIDEAKQDTHYELTKYTSEYKERKAKGEVIDSYYKVTLTKDFTDEKEPDVQTKITYETSYTSFPEPEDE